MKIGIVGRQLSHRKWEVLFDILDQGVAAEAWEYNRYSLDNGKAYAGSEDDCLIFLATTPKFEEGKEYIQFTSSADDEQIKRVMQEFIDSIYEYPGDPPDPGSFPEEEAAFKEALMEIINNDPRFIKPNIINVDDALALVDSLAEEVPFADPMTNEDYVDAAKHLYNCSIQENPDLTKGVGFEYAAIKRLDGVVIDIAGKDVMLHKDDVDKICQLMKFCSENGYRIKDVICS